MLGFLGNNERNMKFLRPYASRKFFSLENRP